MRHDVITVRVNKSRWQNQATGPRCRRGKHLRTGVPPGKQESWLLPTERASAEKTRMNGLSCGEKIMTIRSAWQHVPIYLQPFTSYSEILVGNCNFYLTPLHLTPPFRCSHWNSWKKFGPQKTRIMGLRGNECVVGVPLRNNALNS